MLLAAFSLTLWHRKTAGVLQRDRGLAVKTKKTFGLPRASPRERWQVP